jgi:hypothetical protein
MAKRLREQEDTEMEDAQPRPTHHPAKALPLTSYIGPPQTRSSPRNIKPKSSQKTTKSLKAKAPKPAPDPFFPSFPEPLCYHLGCHSLSPHTHAHNQHLLLPTAEALRKAYEEAEVQEARQWLGKGLRARPRYASATASSVGLSATNTPRPSQKMRDAATVRHGLKVKGELPASKQLHTASPAVSSPLKPPGSRMTGALRRALPVLPKGQQQSRKQPISQIIAPRSDLATGPQKPTSISKPSRMKTRSQKSPQGAGSWVQNLEDADQLHRIVSGIEVIDLTGDD